MNDIPIAVINGASRGAPRSGRYATSSIDALSVPQKAIAITKTPKTDSQTTIPRWPSVSPKRPPARVAESSPPSMKTSPWAKLINSRIP